MRRNDMAGAGLFDAAGRVRFSVLYVESDSVYKRLAVDCWDAERDATGYSGPAPVIAHPPCAHYGALGWRAIAPGKGLAEIAVGQVQRWGGILEHPANSALWKLCGLPKPGEPHGAFGGYSVEVCQSDFGHRALKRTWLYCVGIRLADMPAQRAPTGTVEAMGRRERMATPEPFARWLLSARLA